MDLEITKAEELNDSLRAVRLLNGNEWDGVSDYVTFIQWMNVGQG